MSTFTSTKCETKRTAQLAGQLAEVRLRPLAATPQLQSCTSSRCAQPAAQLAAGKAKRYMYTALEKRVTVSQNICKSQLRKTYSVERRCTSQLRTIYSAEHTSTKIIVSDKYVHCAGEQTCLKELSPFIGTHLHTIRSVIRRYDSR